MGVWSGSVEGVRVGGCKSGSVEWECGTVKLAHIQLDVPYQTDKDIPPNKVSHLGVGTSWNVRLLSVQRHSHDDCNRQHVMERHTATHHLIQHHAKTVHICWELVAGIVESVRLAQACPKHS